MNDETLWDVMQAANVSHLEVSFTFDENRIQRDANWEKHVAIDQMARRLGELIAMKMSGDLESRNYRVNGNRHELYTMFCTRQRLHDLLTRAYNAGYAAGLERMPSATFREILR